MGQAHPIQSVQYLEYHPGRVLSLSSPSKAFQRNPWSFWWTKNTPKDTFWKHPSLPLDGDSLTTPAPRTAQALKIHLWVISKSSESFHWSFYLRTQYGLVLIGPLCVWKTVLKSPNKKPSHIMCVVWEIHTTSPLPSRGNHCQFTVLLKLSLWGRCQKIGKERGLANWPDGLVALNNTDLNVVHFVVSHF